MLISGFSIAIDGPGGAGKSTIARMLASELGFTHIDTGAMYRAVALFCINEKIPFEQARVEQRLDDIHITIRHTNGKQHIFLSDEDVSETIRTPAVSEGASKVAVFTGVRNKLVALQRQMAASGNIIMDGRDIGTYVLPSANVKIYLDACVNQRTRRRQEELLSRGIEAEFSQTKAEVVERDYRDCNRESSPLRRAEDAVLVTTDDMSLEEVKNRLLSIITDKIQVTGAGEREPLSTGHWPLATDHYER